MIPTDPRKAVTADFCAQTNQELSREDLHKLMEQLESTNSNLAAEIARMLASNGKFRSDVLFAIAGTREQLPDEQIIETAKSVAAEIAELKEDRNNNYSLRVQAESQRDHLADLLKQGREAYTTQSEELATLRAELEAARKELFESQMANGELLIELQHCPTCAKNIEQRDTALAAKDAAEKRVAKMERNMKEIANPENYQGGSSKFFYMTHLIAFAKSALTPAPTQEPPAGGVIESKNDYPGVELGSAIINVDTGELVSPADVPTEGRGEWMPIETAPKDRTIQGWSGGWIPEMEWHSNAWCVWDEIESQWSPLHYQPTHWQPLPLAPLPPEGSGA